MPPGVLCSKNSDNETEGVDNLKTILPTDSPGLRMVADCKTFKQGACERSNCHGSDLQITEILVEANCNRPEVGGVDDTNGQLANLNATLGGRENTSATTSVLASFTGRSERVQATCVKSSVGLTLGLIGFLTIL